MCLECLRINEKENKECALEMNSLIFDLQEKGYTDNSIANGVLFEVFLSFSFVLFFIIKCVTNLSISLILLKFFARFDFERSMHFFRFTSYNV